MIILIVIASLRSNDITIPPVDPQAPVPSGFFCNSDSDCLSGSICDVNSTCRLSNDSQCDNDWQCNFNAYCSKVCIDNSIQPNFITEEPRDPCPCTSSFICFQGRCLAQGSVACNEDADCFSGFCSNGTCDARRPDGIVCSNNNQCASLNCSEGICQPVDIATGSLGAACSPSFPCNSNLACSFDIRNSIPGIGRCVSNEIGLNSSCNRISPCSDLLACYNGILPASSLNDGGSSINVIPCNSTSSDNNFTCICSFNYPSENGTRIPRPNIPINNSCVTNATFSNGSCLYSSGQICRSGENCTSGNCPIQGGFFFLIIEGGEYSATGTANLTNLQFRRFDTLLGDSVLNFSTATDGINEIIVALTPDGFFLQDFEDVASWTNIPTGAAEGTWTAAIEINQNLRPLIAVSSTSIYWWNGTTLFPVNSVNAGQYNANGDSIAFQSFSILDATSSFFTSDNFVTGLDMIISSGSDIYLKNSSEDIYTRVPINNAASFANANLILLPGGARAISYINNNMRLAFYNLATSSLENTIWPPSYGSVLPTVVSYSLKTSNSRLNGFVLAQVEDELIGYIINSNNITPIPGYFNSSVVSASSSVNFYLFSPRFCA